MPRYETRISIAPELYDGAMKHRWTIVQINEEGTFTIREGWGDTYNNASYYANRASQDLMRTL